MNEPIGLEGLANAGSSRATSTCVITVTAWRSIPSRRKSFSRFCVSA